MKCAVLFLLITTLPVMAKDLGVRGQLYPVAEESMLVFIQHRLAQMQKDGELSALQQQAIAQVKAHAQRPGSVVGVTDALTDKVFYYDPTFTVGRTLSDLQGRVFAKKGERVNPLSQLPFNQVMVFLNGDNLAQLNWFKQRFHDRSDVKAILTRGNVKDVSDKLNRQIFFDQSGVMTKKLGIDAVPAVVSKDTLRLKIEEFAVGGMK